MRIMISVPSPQGLVNRRERKGKKIDVKKEKRGGEGRRNRPIDLSIIPLW